MYKVRVCRRCGGYVESSSYLDLTDGIESQVVAVPGDRNVSRVYGGGCVGHNVVADAYVDRGQEDGS